MKTLIGSINRSPLRCGFFTMAIALAWFALSPPLKAQDCPSTCTALGLNTGVGTNALSSVNPAAGGINNTAVGFGALRDNTTGFYNTAVGIGRSNRTPLATLTWPLGRRRSTKTTPTSTWPLVFEWAS